MNTQLFEIVGTFETPSPFGVEVCRETRVLAVCSTKKTAIGKLKELADEPSCNERIVNRTTKTLRCFLLKTRAAIGQSTRLLK